MKRSLVEVYALAVCFVTLVCFVVSLGIGLYDVIQITKPEFTLSSYKYEQYKSNEAFVRNWPKDKRRPSDEELTKMRKDSYQTAVKSEQRDAVQSLTQVFIVMLIDVVVFIIHWYMARRVRAMAPGT